MSMIFFLALALQSSAASLDADYRAHNCADPQNQADMNICEVIALARADAELNAEYARAIERARASDRESASYRLESDTRPGEEATLREAQRAWVTFRDAHCRLMGYEARGGSMEPMLYNGCRAGITRERTGQLRAQPLSGE